MTRHIVSLLLSSLHSLFTHRKMSTKAVLSSRASYKSSSATLNNNDVDDKYHSCTTSIDANSLDPESGPANALNHGRLCTTTAAHDRFACVDCSPT